MSPLSLHVSSQALSRAATVLECLLSFQGLVKFPTLIPSREVTASGAACSVSLWAWLQDRVLCFSTVLKRFALASAQKSQQADSGGALLSTNWGSFSAPPAWMADRWSWLFHRRSSRQIPPLWARLFCLLQLAKGALAVLVRLLTSWSSIWLKLI